MYRNKSFWLFLGAVVLLPVVALAWWLGSPLFLNKTVEEAFPVAVVAPVSASQVATSASTAEPEGVVAEESMAEEEMMEPVVEAQQETATEESPPEEAGGAERDRPTEAGAIDEVTDETVRSTGDEAASPSTGPVALVSGTFRDADSFHQGSGQATIYQLEDGSYVLRFEEFTVTNGPDLHVYLTSHPDPTAPSDIDSTGYIDLGPLKGNVGSQNYEIPADVEISALGSVVIYCQPFHVLFSVAPLAAGS